MDIDCSFGEHLVVSARGVTRHYQHLEDTAAAGRTLIGMASVVQDTALYAEAMNEDGLYCAGLNFPRTAHYGQPLKGRINLAPYELIPYLLTHAQELLTRINLCDTPFVPGLPVAPMHFFFSDGTQHLVIEPQVDGLHVYEDDIAVLTNNPPYPTQRANLENYLHLRRANEGGGILPASPYGEGLAMVGLPGDYSPMSRYVRTAILKASLEQVGAEESPHPEAEVMHLLHAVSMVRGSVITAAQNYDITRYCVCFSTETGTCTFHTYDNVQPYAVSFSDHDLDGEELQVYALPSTSTPRQPSLKTKVASKLGQS